MRTVVTFKSSAFNMTEEKDYFINPSCFGDDVAKWLIQELRSRGVHTDDEPGQEDFGWYLGFRIGDADYDLVLSHQPDEEGDEVRWILYVERAKGLVASMLGLRKRGIQSEAVQMIHTVLSGSPLIREVRWHNQAQLDRGDQDNGSEVP